jgi:hypothetical protein
MRWMLQHLQVQVFEVLTVWAAMCRRALSCNIATLSTVFLGVRLKIWFQLVPK